MSKKVHEDYIHTKQEEEKQKSSSLQSRLESRLKEAWEEEVSNSPSMLMKKSHERLFPTVKAVNVQSLVKSNKMIPDLGDESRTLQAAIQTSWEERRPRNISLFGIGGGGKTVSLLSLHFSVMMIYIPLRALSSTLTIEKYIRDNTLQSDNDLYNTFMLNCNKPYQGQPNVIMILDGLNEIGGEAKIGVKREIANIWCRKQIQLVISSRYDAAVEFPLMDMMSLQIELLDKKQVEDYLRSVQLPIPDSFSRLWRVLNTPLMLNLYAHVELFRQLYQGRPDISLYPSINAGSIIWNYLQSEIYKSALSYENHAITTVAAEYIAPYIAFEMQISDEHGVFSLSDEQMYDAIDTANNLFQKDKNAHCLPKHIRTVFSRNPCDITTTKLHEVLTQKMCIFVHIDGNVQFMHQHFRDALAALHLYQSAQTAIDKIPDIWLRSIDEYVRDFLADYLESVDSSLESIWSKLWGIFQNQRDSYIAIVRDSFIEKMLYLYRKAYGSNLAKVNFSGLDLSNISLLGYQLDGGVSDHFIGTKIGNKTISGDGHRMMICSLSWNSDNSAYVSASHDCTLRIWNGETQENTEIITENFYKHYIRCAQWNPYNDKLIAAAGDDNQVIVWSNNNGDWQPECVGNSADWIFSLCWNRQGEWLYCGDRSGNVCAYSIRGEIKKYDRHHMRKVGCISDGSNGLFATGDDGGLVCIWKHCESSPKLSLHFNGTIKAIQWANQGTIISVFTDSVFYYIDYGYLIENEKRDWREGCDEGVIWSDQEQGICTAVIGTRDGKDYCAVLLRNYVLITEGFRDQNGKYHVFRIVSKEILEEDIGIMACAAWDKTCTSLIIGSRDGSIWTGTLLQQEDTFERLILRKSSPGNNNSVRCSAWNRNGSLLAAGYDDGKIRIWNVKERRCTRILTDHSDSVRCLAWMNGKDDTQLAAGSNDGSITIWNIKEEKYVYKSGHSLSPVNCVVWMKNGYIIFGTDNRGLFICDPKSKNYIQIEDLQKGKVYSVIESEPGGYFISAGDDKCMYVWKQGEVLDDTCLIQRIESGHTEPIRDLVRVPAINGIVSAANDGMLIYHKLLPDGKLLESEHKNLEHIHRDFIYSVILSGNKKYIASGSTDSTIGIWDASSLKYLTRGRDHDSFVWDVSASPERQDKCYIASSSSDGTIRIWDVTDIDSAKNLQSSLMLVALPSISLVDCDFSKASIENESLVNLLIMNGGIFNRNS